MSKWWTFFDKLRGEVDLGDFNTVARHAIKEDILVEWRDLVELRRELSRRLGLIGLPHYAYEFLGRYASRIGAESILDPCARTGALITAVVDEVGSESEGVGILSRSSHAGIAKAISKELPLTWIEGEPQTVLLSLSSSYDFIVSAPPINSERETEHFEVNGEELKVWDKRGVCRFFGLHEP